MLARNVAESESMDVPDFLDIPKEYQHFLRVGESTFVLGLDWRFAASERTRWNAFRALRKNIHVNFVLIAHGIIGRCVKTEIQNRIQNIAEHVAAENLFQAREGAMSLLQVEPLEPSIFSRVRNAFPALAYYLDEIADGEETFPGLIAHLNACRFALGANDIEASRLYFDAIPAELSLNLPVQEIECRILCREGSHWPAIRIARHLCETWPEDPVGWGTIVCSLSELGYWEESEKVFNAAPRSYELTHQKFNMGRELEKYHRRHRRKKKQKPALEQP